MKIPVALLATAFAAVLSLESWALLKINSLSERMAALEAKVEILSGRHYVSTP